MCSTWMRARALRARCRTSRSVRAQRGDLVAPDRMRRRDRPRRARRAARAAGTRPRNGRRRGGACSSGSTATPSSSSTRRSPVDEPMNTLMPAAPGSRSSSPTSPALSRVPPTQKAKSQCMRPVARAHLVGERRRAGGQRVGVGHLEDGGDAAQHGRARAASPGLPCAPAPARGNAPGCRSRPAGCAGRGSRSSRRRRPAPRSPIAAMRPSRDADVAQAGAVMVDDRAALQDEVVGRCHGASPALAAVPAGGLRNGLSDLQGQVEPPMPTAHLDDRALVSVAGAGCGALPAEHPHHRPRRAGGRRSAGRARC